MAQSNKISFTLLFGLISALCMILFVLGTYWAGPTVFAGWTIWLGRFLVILLAAIAANIEKRVKGGFLDFRAALKVVYGVLVLAILGESLFIWLIPNVIDPHFYQRLVPVMLANTEKAYHKFGSTDDQLRQALDDIRTQNQFSLSRVISGTGFQLVLFFIIALLIAATVRTKNGPTTRPGL